MINISIIQGRLVDEPELKNKDDINYCQFVTTHTGGADKIIL